MGEGNPGWGIAQRVTVRAGARRPVALVNNIGRRSYPTVIRFTDRPWAGPAIHDRDDFGALYGQNPSRS